MDELLQLFSTKVSLSSSFHNEKKHIVEYVSNQNIHETIGKVNTRYQNMLKISFKLTANNIFSLFKFSWREFFAAPKIKNMPIFTEPEEAVISLRGLGVT